MTRDGDAGAVTTAERGAPWTTARLREEGVRLRIVYVLVVQVLFYTPLCFCAAQHFG